ncbi:iron-containing alcohol dehydrogenase [Plantactinospora soyae]|uniref:Alcohol dehydrogenase class IV n=1 Tax=Plantactinospora soyae TaxID=1544732 RepID=A0A927M9X5_9ACTN|nr:iron-containing alcohol dehydrogenase [Plantactinospora soyae]MBE1489807.1 alcohol dehydrogenase class IV [Plantactinospora soyae]
MPAAPAPVQRAVVGPGAVAAVPAEAEAICGIPASELDTLLVVGPGFDTRPWAERLVAALRPLPIRRYVQPGPATPAGVLRLARLLRDDRPGIVLAVGGGTVLDTVKAAVALQPYPDLDERDVARGCDDPEPRRRWRTGVCTRPAVVAVPSTPGTGAEATPFATLWDTAGGRKLSLTGPELLPGAVILDPDLLVGLDRTVLVGAVLDTICQGAEAAWSIRSTPASTAFGLTALGTAAGVLDRLVAGRLDDAGRLALLLAGHHSGRAIAAAPTSSCHAISYPLTLWLGLAHGHACGVSLPRLLRHNADVTTADCADPRGVRHVRAVVDRIAVALAADAVPGTGGTVAARAGTVAARAGAAAARVERLLAGAGLAPLDELPVDAHDLAVEALNYPRCHDNPRRLDVPVLRRLLGTPLGLEESCS